MFISRLCSSTRVLHVYPFSVIIAFISSGYIICLYKVSLRSLSSKEHLVCIKFYILVKCTYIQKYHRWKIGKLKSRITTTTHYYMIIVLTANVWICYRTTYCVSCYGSKEYYGSLRCVTLPLLNNCSFCLMLIF